MGAPGGVGTAGLAETLECVLVRSRLSVQGVLAYESVHRGLGGRSGHAELSALCCAEHQKSRIPTEHVESAIPLTM